MFNQAPDLFLSALPPPKKLLHYVCFFCLVGWGVSATVVASHGGIHAAWFEWTRQLALLCFFGLIAFGFFYIEYVAVERLAGRELNETLGHLQVAGGAVLLLAAVVVDLAAIITNDPQFVSSALGDTRSRFCLECADDLRFGEQNQGTRAGRDSDLAAYGTCGRHDCAENCRAFQLVQFSGSHLRDCGGVFPSRGNIPDREVSRTPAAGRRRRADLRFARILVAATGDPVCSVRHNLLVHRNFHRPDVRSLRHAPALHLHHSCGSRFHPDLLELVGNDVEHELAGSGRCGFLRSPCISSSRHWRPYLEYLRELSVAHTYRLGPGC